MCAQVSSNDAAHAFSNKCTAPRTVMNPGAVPTYVGTRNVYVSACKITTPWGSHSMIIGTDEKSYAQNPRFSFPYAKEYTLPPPASDAHNPYYFYPYPTSLSYPPTSSLSHLGSQHGCPTQSHPDRFCTKCKLSLMPTNGNS
jgi:hypothetical protein